MTYLEKIGALRREMRADGLDAYIVYAFDPHRSIAIADHWKTVQWLTGFTGWVCTLVVTADKAAFWTDGRYVRQAERELESPEIERYCISDPVDPTYAGWLARELPRGGAVGLDGRVVSAAEFAALKTALGRKEARLACERDLVGAVWHDRPAIPKAGLFELGLGYAGESRRDKLARVRARMAAAGADVYVLSALDDIAWLTNLRGGDSPLYPIFHGFAAVLADRALLFTPEEKLDAGLKARLAEDGFELRPMDGVPSLLAGLPRGSGVYYDPFKTGMLFARSVGEGCFVIEGMDLVTGLKCRKNEIELANIRQANVLEAVGVTRLIRHIKENVGKIPLDEYAVGQWIMDERRKNPEFVGPANIPIVGCRGNAVQLHYRPTREKSDPLPAEGLVLFDLCAHYLLGSTDITRTVALGPLTEQMKQDYTLTLKSHIKLARQKFLYGTTGPALDCLIKGDHWNLGLTYGAGTGHGMGYCLYIQEGPCKIALDASPYFNYMFQAPIEPGMIFSNEPGVYRAGSHAIRIENTIAAREAVTNEYGRFLEFETLTYMPLEMEAVLPDRLTGEERDWINAYNAELRRLLRPRLDADEMAWLETQTRAI